MNENLLFGGIYLTNTFSEIYPTYDDFLTDATEFEKIGLITIEIKEKLPLIYYALLSKYKNNPIASIDPYEFKYSLFTTIYRFGSPWVKRIKIQEEIHKAEIETIRDEVALDIDNHAYNPSQLISEQNPIINKIDQQTTHRKKKGLLETYAELSVLIEADLLADFLEHFLPLFSPFVSPITEIGYIPLAELISNNIEGDNND